MLQAPPEQSTPRPASPERASGSQDLDTRSRGVELEAVSDLITAQPQTILTMLNIQELERMMPYLKEDKKRKVRATIAQVKEELVQQMIIFLEDRTGSELNFDEQQLEELTKGLCSKERVSGPLETLRLELIEEQIQEISRIRARLREAEEAEKREGDTKEKAKKAEERARIAEEKVKKLTAKIEEVNKIENQRPVEVRQASMRISELEQLIVVLEKEIEESREKVSIADDILASVTKSEQLEAASLALLIQQPQKDEVIPVAERELQVAKQRIEELTEQLEAVGEAAKVAEPSISKLTRDLEYKELDVELERRTIEELTRKLALSEQREAKLVTQLKAVEQRAEEQDYKCQLY